MPYAMIHGQDQLKLALELAFVARRIEGVLLSGHRGTGKSTAVRSFAMMAYGRLPVTLPINATEDRVVGDWKLDELLRGKLTPQEGLLEQAHGSVLYIDEVNLLDDHIVNIILDVTSTGRLVAQRNRQIDQEVRFTLVGTMNPSEGGLRPQLLDRFGLMVDVSAPTSKEARVKILKAVLDFDARKGNTDAANQVQAARNQDAERRTQLQNAQARFQEVTLPDAMAQRCVDLASAFKVEGHRGDYVLALAAQAHAALNGRFKVTTEDLSPVIQLALQHRLPGALQGGGLLWGDEQRRLAEVVLRSKTNE
jgi:magnesium chelatase subunit I